MQKLTEFLSACISLVRQGHGASRTQTKRLFHSHSSNRHQRTNLVMAPFSMFQLTGPEQREPRETTTTKQSLASKQEFAGSKDKQLPAVPVWFLLRGGGVWRSETLPPKATG